MLKIVSEVTIRYAAASGSGHQEHDELPDNFIDEHAVYLEDVPNETINEQIVQFYCVRP